MASIVYSLLTAVVVFGLLKVVYMDPWKKKKRILSIEEIHRLVVYEGVMAALLEIQRTARKERDYDDIGLCYRLYKSSGISEVRMEEVLKKNFPEVFELKPAAPYCDRFWFERSAVGLQQRIDLMSKVITSFK